jgi:hypothetical protein
LFALSAPSPADLTNATGREDLKGHVWVTRQGVFIDRIVCAWLVRRFIDPDAHFKIVPPKGSVPEKGELRFDMFEAEFTHEGDRCSSKDILARSGLQDRALQAIAEIVHDIDLKDEKFGRTECAGIRALFAGMAMAQDDDEARIDAGGAILENLYAYFRKRPSSANPWNGPGERKTGRMAPGGFGYSARSRA